MVIKIKKVPNKPGDLARVSVKVPPDFLWLPVKCERKGMNQRANYSIFSRFLKKYRVTRQSFQPAKDSQTHKRTQGKDKMHSALRKMWSKGKKMKLNMTGKPFIRI